jgi:hypothetical protein
MKELNAASLNMNRTCGSPVLSYNNVTLIVSRCGGGGGVHLISLIEFRTPSEKLPRAPNKKDGSCKSFHLSAAAA